MDEKKPKHPGGRPTEYDSEFCQIAASLAINGGTDAEIADELGVSVRTLYRWKAQHPQFRQALIYGKEQADDRVERSLYLRAVGYEHDAVKISFGKDGQVHYAPYRVLVPPDPPAAIFWLKNRRPEHWRDRVDVSRPDDPLTELLAEMRKQHEAGAE